MSCNPRQSLRILTAGVLALVIAMGISRFAYTPLIPVMQAGLHFPDELAGYLASANLAGYLLGALWLTWRPLEGAETRTLRAHLLINLASTIAMGLTASFPVWLLLRFVAGLSSGFIFVLASGLVLQHLAIHQRQGWSGWLYSAIGIGIVVSALTVPPLGSHFGWRGGWLGLGAICFLLAYPPYHWLEEQHRENMAPTAASTPAVHPRGMLIWLTAAYFCEGLGYIVTGTFLVTLLQRMPGLEHSSTLAWLVVGLAAAPSSILWMKLGLRLEPARCLVIAHLAQALGIILPVLWPTPAGTLLGAVCYGGTFMGIVTLSLFLGRQITPRSPQRTIGMLTTAFGAGQIIGPSAAGLIASRSLSFTPALLGASGIVALGALLLTLGLLLQRHAGQST